MKSFTKLMEYNSKINMLKSYISELNLDTNVFNYINIFDNIIEEPIYKDNNQFVIYVSKKNNIKKMWIEHNSKQISKIMNFDTLADIIKNIFNI